NGTLTTDDYSLQEVTPQQTSNLLPNGDFEQAGSNSLPLDWIRGGYGSNTRVFSYPVAGQTGNGAKLTVTNYVSGDAKWASNPVSVSPGTYTYADSYLSTVPSTLTAEFTHSDGSLSYSDLKVLPAASSWTSASASFTVPTDVTHVRVFHLIQANGSLTIDNASIVEAQGSQSGIFSTGAVTFRFDDGLLDQYQNAVPVLKADGLTATFYIITHEIADDGFTGYMSIAQVQNLYGEGFEIGAHTRTHPHLTTLSAQEQQDEIAGSRQDLLGWNVGPVLSFAYPFGEYDTTTLGIVKDAGFSSAVSTMSGYVTPSSDHYQLEYQELHNDTTLAQVKQWVDDAAQNHVWLILTFHDISSNTNDEYNTTPSLFKSIAAYVKQKGIPVVSATQGIDSM
ncbi:MAG TPA: polysaccharide deacetylase family protein, partial [Candidatus Paceibacterota bacterium]|nr:polysaccharide deacetylase family protein [Candidatus Paceibacterota bacterium]